MQAIINGEMYEVEPAVKVIIDKLMMENTELKKENARLEESFQRAMGEIAADPLPGAKVDRERFGKAAEEVFDNVKDELDRVAIADFVNQLENALFGGSQ
jgi:hypothetical protein